MFRSLHLPLLFAVVASCTLVQAQRRDDFPPDVLLDRFIDVAKAAPQQFSVEMQNSEVRVLRAKLGGNVRIPIHDDRSGLIVALTDVHLRFTTPDKKFRDIHVKAGETHWIDGDTFTKQNLSSSLCEYLFIETLRRTGPVPYTPPV